MLRLRSRSTRILKTTKESTLLKLSSVITFCIMSWVQQSLCQLGLNTVDRGAQEYMFGSWQKSFAVVLCFSDQTVVHHCEPESNKQTVQWEHITFPFTNTLKAQLSA
jgi:hypothetical protein